MGQGPLGRPAPDPVAVYREFNVRRAGPLDWEPVIIVMVDGQPIVRGTAARFWTRTQAVRVSLLMMAQYNDGLRAAGGSAPPASSTCARDG